MYPQLTDSDNEADLVAVKTDEEEEENLVNLAKEMTVGEADQPVKAEDSVSSRDSIKFQQPGTSTGKRYWFIGAVAAAVAAPVAITAAVGALGFGAGGIAAGSAASWMMSLGGGATPAIVATCQSIGATGAISGATQAVIGGTVYGAKLVKDFWQGQPGPNFEKK